MRCRLETSKECVTLPEAEKYPQGLALSPWGGFSVGAGMGLGGQRAAQAVAADGQILERVLE
jgi:hypothetical protein